MIVDLPTQIAQAPAGQSTTTKQTVTTRTRRTHGLTSDPWCTGTSWASFGTRASLVPTAQDSYKDFSLAMQISLPLAQTVGRYAFNLAVNVRTFPLCPLKMKFLHPSSLGISRILPDDDAFMLACAVGDRTMVRRMLETGRGRPSDITEHNWTPLTVGSQR